MVNVEKGKNAELTVTAINNEDKTVNCRVTVKDENGNTVATSEEVTLLASEKKVFPISWVVPGYKDDGNKKYYICAENGSDVISKRGVNVNITSNTRIYGSFEALKFEDYEKLSITDKHSSIQYIENGEGVNSVHSGSGALYINGNGAIKISVSETDSEIKPADGDLIDGEYYIKVMEQTPTDWKQPIIRLYGILGAEKMLLCETENLNTYSVWNTKRFEWNRLTLKSTGIPYCEGMELVCEIIVGIGANGGLKFMLDDISYFSSYNEKDDG